MVIVLPCGPLLCSPILEALCRHDILPIITDSTTADGDFHVTTALREEAGSISTIVLLIIIAHLAVAFNACVVQTVAHRAQTSATVDGAQHLTARNVHCHRTCHVTGSIGIASESTTATEDVTIYV